MTVAVVAIAGVAAGLWLRSSTTDVRTGPTLPTHLVPVETALDAARAADETQRHSSGVAATRSTLQSTQPTTFSAAEVVTGATARLSLTPIRGSDAQRLDAGDGVVAYRNAWPDVDVVRHEQRATLKESIVVRRESRRGSFAWTVSGTATLKRNPNGSLRAYTRGTATALTAPAPVVLDVDGAPIAGATARYALTPGATSGTQTLRLTWAVPPDTQFPINVDPTFTTGQSASTVLGVRSFTDTEYHMGNDTWGLGDARSISAAGSGLLISERLSYGSQQRIYSYNSLPTSNAQPFDGSIGNWNSGNSGYYRPMGVWSDGTKVAIVDPRNNRVMLWNTIPPTNTTPADVVLGQPNFTSVAGGTGASGMRSPDRVTFDGTNLVVSDNGNNRVLIWNSWPTTNGQAANVVLGQADMLGSNANRGASRNAGALNSPMGVWSNGTSLYVADTSNNRVLGWTTFPTSNGQFADVVVGQSAMNAGSCNTLGGKQGLCSPYGITGGASGLFVADYSNSRILRWNSLPTVNGTTADVEIGQRGVPGTSSTLLRNAMDVAVVGSKLALLDYGNARVLIYDSIPSADGAAADHVIGQTDMNNGGRKGGRGEVLMQPEGVAFDSAGRLFVSNGGSNSIMRFPASLPPTGGTADVGIGQYGPGGPSTPGLSTTGSFYGISISPDNKLFAAGTYHARAVWWDPVPATAATMSGVVGQADFNSATVNRGGAADRNTISNAFDVAYDGTSHLVVADYENHRVLIWNSLPAVNGPAADVVLGQPNGTSTAPNNGGLSSSSLNQPLGVRIWDGKLIVADAQNHRVLIWNSIPTTDNAPADIVLGQPNMSSNTAGTTATTLRAPRAIAVADGVLAVADGDNRRVLIWDTFPTASGTPPDRVVGQPNMTTNTCAKTADKLCEPRFIALRAGRLAVSDAAQRVLIFDDVVAPVTSGISALQAGERTTFTYATDEQAVTEVVYDTVPHPGGSGYASSTGASPAMRNHSMVATGLVPGTTYYYRVVATDSYGNVSQSPEYSVITSNTSTFEIAPAVGDDTTVNEASSLDNYGGSTTIDIGGSGGATRHRGLVRFDLAQLPAGAVVTSATLTLHATDAGSGTAPSIGARRIDAPWTEGVGTGAPQPDGASWETTDGVDPWTSAGGDTTGAVVGTDTAPTATPGTLDIDVTSAVTAWVTNGDPNEGLLLAPTTEPATDLVRFASGNHPIPSLRPRLTVAWQGSDTTNPVISTVRVKMLSAVSMEVSWDTDEAATSSVEFGTTTAYTGGTVTDPAAVNHHVVTLTGLDMNTLYHLRVRSTDAQGNEGVSGDTVARTSYRAVIEPTDTFVRADMPNRNNGNQASLFVGNSATYWQTANSFLHFDTSSVPAGATIRSATFDATTSAQVGTTSPVLEARELTTSFTEGTGNATVGPTAAIAASGTTTGQAALTSPAERHVALTSRGWFSTWGYYGSDEVLVRYRRSYDGLTFGGDATLYSGFGRTGVAIDQDAATLWAAYFGDSTSRLYVKRVDDASAADLLSGSVLMPSGTVASPSVKVASDGYLFAKGETAGGAVWVARSTAPRDPTTWGAAVQIAAQSAPGHALLVPLAGGQMAALSLDGSMVSLTVWSGTSWSAPTLVASNVLAVTNWLGNSSVHAVPDGSGGMWMTYVSTTNDVVAMRYTAGAWGSPETVQSGGVAAVAISRDTGADEPHVAWQSGTNIVTSKRVAGVWTAGQTLQTGVSATYSQVSMSPPSNEALAVTWAEPSGANSVIRWRAYALNKPADGATWATTNGAAAWSTPGGDVAGAAFASAAAPNAVGGKLSMDVTAQFEDWHDGSSPNRGFVLRKQTDNPALNDWKAYYSSEAPTPSLRPHITIDYDLATITVSQPNASTAWRNGQTAEVTWQTSGSGLTHVNLELSADNGATWSPIATNIPNTGSYFWTVAGTTGSYRIRVEALALGSPVTNDVSASFVVEDVPPDPITDLAVNSPSSAAALTWSEPADSGGAGMANGSYRVYRSTTNGVQGARIATISALTYTDNSALADGPWYYTVIPVDAAGNAQPVGNDQVMTIHDGSAPNAVTDLAAPGLSNVPVALSWSAVTDVGAAGIAGYRIYRSTSIGVRGSLVTTVAGTSTADTPPSDGTFYYTVAPIDAAGNVQLTGNNQVGAVYDTIAPTPVTLTLDAGAAWTGTTAVSAGLTYGDATQVQLSESAAFVGASWVAVGATLPFTLSSADGSHTVYARFRDPAGNISTTATDSIGLDRTAPGTVASLRDGVGAGDADFQGSLTSISAIWSAASDAHSGIARYDTCISTLSGCAGTVIQTWSSVGTATTSTAGSLTLTAGERYYVCVRSVDGVGNTSSTCTDGITVVAVDSLTPNSAPQGRKSLAIQIDGAGFHAADTVSVSGTGVSVTSTTFVDATQIDIVVDVTAAAATGARSVTVRSPDGYNHVVPAALTINAPSITVSIGTLSYDGTSTPISALGPFAVDLGSVLPGTARELGTPTSGQTTPGAALDVQVRSDTDWSLAASTTNFTGPAALAAGSLAWKHHGVTEAWTPFATSAGGVETQRVPNAPGSTTFSYDLRWTIPPAQAAGAYSTTTSMIVVPAP